jgi:hypothetical protein
MSYRPDPTEIPHNYHVEPIPEHLRNTGQTQQPQPQQTGSWPVYGQGQQEIVPTPQPQQPYYPQQQPMPPAQPYGYPPQPQYYPQPQGYYPPPVQPYAAPVVVAMGMGQQYACRSCGSNIQPMVNRRISTGGWVTFGVLLILFFPLCWVGLLMKENYQQCGQCGVKFS